MEKIDENTSLIGFDFEPQAIVMGGGDFPSHRMPLNLLEKQRQLVCCDGAANVCLAKGIQPWRVVGDGDSISPVARKAFHDMIRVNPDQETNDQTKAVEYLEEKGIRKIAIIAATGRREDHTLGNISLLMEYQRKGLEVRMYTDTGIFIPCRDKCVFQCPVGTAVSIFGFGTEGMTSTGLAYPLYDFTSWWQGTLNHTTQECFTIDCRGEYLVFLNYENKKLREVIS